MTEHGLPYIQEVLLFLGLTGILIPLLARFNINQVLGFLAVGTIVGPFGLGLWTVEFPILKYFTFKDVKGAGHLAELGILFLMFTIGLELSAERLWSLRKWVFVAGTAQVVLCATALGAVTYTILGRLDTAVIMGFVLALSSTAVAMQLMTQNKTLATPLGQASFSILMLQDLAVVPLFILLGVMTGGSREDLWLTMGLTLLKSITVIALIYVVGRRLIRPVFHTFAHNKAPDVFMALTLLASLGISALTAAAGLSMALGAFLAGVLLAETEFKHEVEVTIEPFKGLLMGLFFMSVGMHIDVRFIIAAPWTIAAGVLGLFFIKSLIFTLIFKLGKLKLGKAIKGGLLLGQGGEFAFIIVGAAITGGLLQKSAGQYVMIVVGLSMFVTPFFAKLGQNISDFLATREKQDLPSNVFITPEATSGQVVIVGFGRVGRLVAQLLTEQGVSYIAFDGNARVVTKYHEQGLPVYYGNSARAELLHKIHAERASAVVLTMDEPEDALKAVIAIRNEYPHLTILARSRDEEHAVKLKQSGASIVIPETLESSLQLSGFVLQQLGFTEGHAAHVVQMERDRRIAVFLSQQDAEPVKS